MFTQADLFLWLKVFTVLYILFLITTKLIKHFRNYPTLRRVLRLQRQLQSKATLSKEERWFQYHVTVGNLKAARHWYKEVSR